MNCESQSLCFTCGLEVGDPPRLNRLGSGLPCPTCRDRILAALPPALPGPGSDEFKGAESRAVSKETSGEPGALYSVDFSDPDEPA